MISRVGSKGTFAGAAIKSEREVKEQRDQGKHFKTAKIKHAPLNENGNHPFILCGNYGLLFHKSVVKAICGSRHLRNPA